MHTKSLQQCLRQSRNALMQNIQRTIVRQRRATYIKVVAKLASSFHSIYENHNYNPVENGEYELLRKLSGIDVKCIFDVGAHIGNWSCFVTNLFPQANIHAFEVAPVTFLQLQQQISRLCKQRIHLNNRGLSDSNKCIEMYYYPDHTDLTCDRNRFPQHLHQVISARLQTGDEYVQEKDIKQIDLLKIDVEGTEYAVLKGLNSSLEKEMVHLLYFEFGPFSVDTRILLRDYYDLLGKKFWIGKIYPNYVDFRDYNWRYEDFRPAHYLAVLRSRPDLKRLLS